MRKKETPDEVMGADDRLVVGLVGSSGGHLAHLLILKPWWENHDRFWVTFDMPDSHDLLESERCDWAHHPTTRNIPNLLRNFRLAWRVLRRERPDALISTGAAVASSSRCRVRASSCCAACVRTLAAVASF